MCDVCITGCTCRVWPRPATELEQLQSVSSSKVGVSPKCEQLQTGQRAPPSSQLTPLELANCTFCVLSKAQKPLHAPHTVHWANTHWINTHCHWHCVVSWDLETLVDFLSGQIWLRHRVVPQISTWRCMLDPIDILVITVSNTTSASMLNAVLIFTLINFSPYCVHISSSSSSPAIVLKSWHRVSPSPLPNCLIPWIGRFPNVEIFNLRSLQFELGDSQQFGPGCINYIQMSTTSMKSNNQMRTIIWY